MKNLEFSMKELRLSLSLSRFANLPFLASFAPWVSRRSLLVSPLTALVLSSSPILHSDYFHSHSLFPSFSSSWWKEVVGRSLIVTNKLGFSRETQPLWFPMTPYPPVGARGEFQSAAAANRGGGGGVRG